MTRSLPHVAIALCFFAGVLSCNGAGLIPIGDDAFTSQDYEEQISLPFYREFILEAYKQHGVHDARWDSAAIAFLKHCVLHEARSYKASSTEDLFEEASHLARDLKCTDPLVRFLFLRYGYETSSRRYPDAIWKLAHDFLNEGYSSLHASMASALSIASMPIDGRQQDGERLRFLQKHLHRALAQRADGDHAREVTRVAFDQVEYTFFKNGVPNMKSLRSWDKFRRAILKDSNVSPWASNVLNGYIEMHYGIEYRGSGYADTVSDRAFAQMEKHFIEAGKYLRRAHKLHPDRPEAATEMMTFAVYGLTPDDEDYVYWFQKAVSAQMDYMTAYKKFTEFARPKWGGDLAQLLEFAVECAETERYDTRVPMIFCDVISIIVSETGGRWEKVTEAGLIGRGTLILREMSKHPGWQKDPDVQSRYAGFAFRAGKMNEAGEAVRRLAGEVNSLTHLAGVYPRVVARIAPARGGPSSDLVLRADTQFEKGNLDAAQELYEDSLDALAEGDMGEKYIRDRLKGIQWSRLFRKGKWVSLKSDESLTGWATRRGVCRATSEGHLQTRVSNPADSPLILCEGRFGHRFEYEMEAVFPRNETDHSASGAAVFCFAENPLWRFRTANVFPNSNEVAVRRDFAFGEILPIEHEVSRVVKIRVVVDDKDCEVFLDGELVDDSPWLREDEPFGLDERVGVGQRSSGMPSKSWTTFRNIRIRKLK